MKCKTLTAALLGLFSLLPATQAEGLFVGGEVSTVMYPKWIDKFTSTAGGAGAAASDQVPSRAGSGVRVGQWLNDSLGWEVGYSDLGSNTGRTVILGGAPEMGTWKFFATAVHLAALGGMKFGKSTLFGKIGMHSSSTKLEGDVIIGNATYSESASGTGLLIGGGYIFPFTEYLSGRAAIDIFNSVEFTDPVLFANSTKETLTKISLGLDYMF